MKIRIRYFASLREALGAGEEIDVPAGLTVAALREHLAERGGRHAEMLAGARPVRCALNQTMAADRDLIPEDAEVAFFPPVTGG
jgi:sulfur-carrier protein